MIVCRHFLPAFQLTKLRPNNLLYSTVCSSTLQSSTGHTKQRSGHVQNLSTFHWDAFRGPKHSKSITTPGCSVDKHLLCVNKDLSSVPGNISRLGWDKTFREPLSVCAANTELYGPRVRQHLSAFTAHTGPFQNNVQLNPELKHPSGVWFGMLCTREAPYIMT